MTSAKGCFEFYRKYVAIKWYWLCPIPWKCVLFYSWKYHNKQVNCWLRKSINHWFNRSWWRNICSDKYFFKVKPLLEAEYGAIGSCTLLLSSVPYSPWGKIADLDREDVRETYIHYCIAISLVESVMQNSLLNI